MKKQEHKIATIISYCTNDYRFLQKCVSGIKAFSSQILVVTCDHFFKGKKENYPLLHQTYAENQDLTFLEISYLHDRLYNPYINRTPQDNDWIDYWHSTTRYIPFFYLNDDIQYVFFLDSDEIVDRETFQMWLDTEEYRNWDALRFLQYYYFRSAKYRARKYQIGGLFAKKSALDPSILFDGDDRAGIFERIQGKKMEGAAFEEDPMIHHYSWVKTKKECLKKAENWCHHWERDWMTLIHQEFSRPFNGRDFIDQRNYEVLDTPFFDPLSVPLIRKEPPEGKFSNVIKVNDQEIFRKQLSYEFQV